MIGLLLQSFKYGSSSLKELFHFIVNAVIFCIFNIL